LSRRRIALGPAGASVTAVRPVSVEPGESAVDRVIERLCDEAHARGVAEGIALAHERAARALCEATEALERRADEAAAAVASTAVELAVEVARHLVRAEVDAGRHDVERIVRETLAAGRVGRAECTVHLHPNDAAALAGVAFRSGTKIEPDVGVGRGEAQVVTPNGLLVRDLDECFADIRRRMRSALGPEDGGA
jgi:flagellar biosynthesis/type III secretory pathway protein FliH